MKLPAEFVDDVLEAFGVEDAGGFAERAQRSPRTTELALHLLEFAGLLDAAERGDDGVEQVLLDLAPFSEPILTFLVRSLW